MAQINVYNKEFQEIDKIEIRDDIFNIEPNMDVLYRYVDMQLTNKRAGTASTKTRAEVRGGGRKPWPQNTQVEQGLVLLDLLYLDMEGLHLDLNQKNTTNP